MDIKIKDGRFQVGLFDKRDGFPFTIVGCHIDKVTSRHICFILINFLVDRVQYGRCVFHDLQNKINNHECIRENIHFKSYVIFLILYLNILTTLLNKNTRSCLLFFIKMNKVEKKIDIILEPLERVEK